MEKAEIKRIGDYLKDLEEGLVEWDYRGITTQGQDKVSQPTAYVRLVPGSQRCASEGRSADNEAREHRPNDVALYSRSQRVRGRGREQA